MTTAWAHLPNAALIDEVLTSLKAHPEKWSTAWDASRGAAQAVLWGSTWAAARDAARDAAWSTVATLIAYDDAGQFMKLPAEQLKAMYRLDPHPMYLLLQPAAVVFMEVEP